MRNILLTISFDGYCYCGWQVQKNGITIQKVLQDAIEKVFEKRLDVIGCSRTDARVHANNFCVNFNTESTLSCDAILKILNIALPYDIVVKSCQEVPLDFHARYSATGKEYIYKIYNSKVRSPFNEHYALHYPYKIDIDKINEAAKFFKGEHDFKAFMTKGSNIANTVRIITQLNAYRDGEYVIITISANGFLYNMVRIITGTLLYVSQGKINTSDIPNIIESRERKKAGPTARPYGLYLNRVFYDNLL